MSRPSWKSREARLLAQHRRLSRGERLRVAFHEAGHAIAALLLGIGVCYVTTKPSVGDGVYTGDSLGHCSLAKDRSRDELTDAIIFAGADVAVEQHLGLPDSHHLDDFGAPVYTEAKAKARELLGTPAARRAVEQLAGRLLREQTVSTFGAVE